MKSMRCPLMMPGSSFSNRIGMRGKYLFVVLIILFAQTLPLQPITEYPFVPDVLMAVTFAWVLRRPDAITPLLVCIAIFLADLVLHRPPGLWTFIILISVIFLQTRSPDMPHMIFAVEWVLVSVVMMACLIVYQVFLVITFVGHQPAVLMVGQAVSTIAVYPLVVFVSRRFLAVNYIAS
ncbi:MAG: rod shape-determining protein MreD [Pseudomonadota bacterium]